MRAVPLIPYSQKLLVYLYHILFTLHAELLDNVPLVAEDLCRYIVPLDSIDNLITKMLIFWIDVYFH